MSNTITFLNTLKQQALNNKTKSIDREAFDTTVESSALKTFLKLEGFSESYTAMTEYVNEQEGSDNVLSLADINAMLKGAEEAKKFYDKLEKSPANKNLALIPQERLSDLVLSDDQENPRWKGVVNTEYTNQNNPEIIKMINTLNERPVSRAALNFLLLQGYKIIPTTLTMENREGYHDSENKVILINTNKTFVSSRTLVHEVFHSLTAPLEKEIINDGQSTSLYEEGLAEVMALQQIGPLFSTTEVDPETHFLKYTLQVAEKIDTTDNWMFKPLKGKEKSTTEGFMEGPIYERLNLEI